MRCRARGGALISSEIRGVSRGGWRMRARRKVPK